MTTRASDNAGAPQVRRASSRETTETKSSYKTTELIVYVLAVLGVLIAAALVTDASFGADHAWRYVTYLTVGYMISRGLAKVTPGGSGLWSRPFCVPEKGAASKCIENPRL